MALAAGVDVITPSYANFIGPAPGASQCCRNFNGPCGSVRVSQFFDMDGEMNPADVAQSAVAPVYAGGFSFVELFHAGAASSSKSS